MGNEKGNNHFEGELVLGNILKMDKTIKYLRGSFGILGQSFWRGFPRVAPVPSDIHVKV